jgi:hypothetical protein
MKCSTAHADGPVSVDDAALQDLLSDVVGVVEARLLLHIEQASCAKTRCCHRDIDIRDRCNTPCHLILTVESPGNDLGSCPAEPIADCDRRDTQDSSISHQRAVEGGWIVCKSPLGHAHYSPEERLSRRQPLFSLS